MVARYVGGTPGYLRVIDDLLRASKTLYVNHCQLTVIHNYNLVSMTFKL
jgi:hypothetical protein